MIRRESKAKVSISRTNSTKEEAHKDLRLLEDEVERCQYEFHDAIASSRYEGLAAQISASRESGALSKARKALNEALGWIERDEPAMAQIRLGLKDVYGKAQPREVLDEVEQAQLTVPQQIATGKGKAYWWYQDKVYVTDDLELTPEDVDALVNEKANARRLKLQKAHALKAMTENLDNRGERQPIPQDVKVLVWQRDSGRCVQCDSNENLEYDHIIPLAMGGSNTDRNLQLLCGDCNRRKGATLG